MTEQSGIQAVQPEAVQKSSGITRRTFIGGGVVVGTGVAAVVGVGSLAERSLRGLNEDKTFRVGTNEVKVFWKEFNPKEGGVIDPSEAVIYLVGAPMRAKASVSWDEPRELAETFKAKSYTIDARPVGDFDTNSIDLEVEGIRKFIEDKDIKKVTIFGHSIGAVKATNLAVSLQQNDPDIYINGVVLANPMGFYNESTRDLLAGQIREGIGAPKLANPKRAPESPVKVVWHYAGSVASDIAETGLQYPQLLGEQLQALTTLNPNMNKVKSPVLVLISSEDQIAEAAKILPEEEIQKRMAPATADDQQRREIAQSGKWERLSDEQRNKFGSKENFIEFYLSKRGQDEMVRRGKARVEYMKSIMPQVENLGVIVATKYANHIGFTVERYKKTAHVASRIFDRLRRPAK